VITTTGRQIVTTSLMMLGSLSPGESVEPGLGDFCLKRLNSMIDSWGILRQTIYQTERVTESLLNGVQNYTIGIGGDFNRARPIFIDGAGYLVPGSSPPVEIGIPVLTDLQYQAQSIKEQTGPLIASIYYNNGNDGGLATITVWQIPTQDLTLVLYIPAAIAQFDLSASVKLTPGYERAITFNLCREIALALGRPITPDLNMLAVDSLGDLKRANYQSNDLGFDLGMVQQTGKYAYNINSDQP